MGHGPADAVANFDNALTTDQKGAVAELAIAHAAVKLGIDVYRPIAEGGRYDMILEAAGRLIRVQCKWVRLRNNVMTIRCYSSRRGATGFINRAYSSTEIDALAAYCPDIDRCFLVPVARIDGRPTVHLRVAPARNNQIRGVNLADDFDFAVTLRALTGP
jgi:hypothetical protein